MARKSSMYSKPTRATVKIFRSTMRRWTVPTWGGGSGVTEKHLGLTQEGFAERYGIPAKRNSPVRDRTDHAAPRGTCLPDRH